MLMAGWRERGGVRGYLFEGIYWRVFGLVGVVGLRWLDFVEFRVVPRVIGRCGYLVIRSTVVVYCASCVMERLH